MPRRREFAFLTTWILACEREPAFAAIEDADRWIEWWPGLVASHRISDGAADGSGQRGRFEWRAAIPYRIGFEMTSERVERPRLLAGRASGDVEGIGVWRLAEAGPGRGGAPRTIVSFDWRVALAKPALAPLAPIAGPVLRWNHDRLMRAGAHGLAARLGCELVAGS